MAERRMFAKTIIDSDAFLEMPVTSQLLYFHLSMRADDDGFINKPKSIMRMIGCKDDDMKLLFAKKFLIPFESGVVVIKHWKIHNYIRKDTYTETKYKEEKSTLELDENSAYRIMEPVPLQLRDESVTGTATQDRLGKDRIGKVSIEVDNIPLDSDESERTESPKLKKKKSNKQKYGAYQNVLLTPEEQAKLEADFGSNYTEKAIAFLDAYIEEKGYKSKSHNLAIRRWVMDAVKENESKPKRYGRKEPVPGWTGFEPGEAELEAIQKVMGKTVGNDPELAERADKLKQSLMG